MDFSICAEATNTMKCKAFKRNGLPCTFKAKKNGFCGHHKMKDLASIVSENSQNPKTDIIKITGNQKRINSCKQRGGSDKKEGHKKEARFNEKYNPSCIKINMKAEADCQIAEDHEILDKLLEHRIIKNKNERNTSNKSGKSIQITLGNIPELEIEDNLEWIQNPKNSKTLLNKYFKKSESQRPANLLVYDTESSILLFNMDDVNNYIATNCKFRKLETGRIKGDFEDNSKKGKRQYITYEYRGTHKSQTLGFSGARGKPFIDLLKTKIKYYEDPY